MKILFNNKLKDYNFEIFNDDGKISLEKGNKINFKNEVKYIVPGFIDQHIHGLLGYDTMDGTFESLNEQSKGLLYEGTTSFFPTTMTASIERLNEVLEVINESKEKVEGAQIVGVHLEGPFINSSKIGAQNPSGLQLLTKDNLKKINNLNLIKIMTYAPELDKDFEFVTFLKDNNIVPSVGHSNASCQEVLDAYKHGLKCYTHLHNACSGYENRNPGVVTSSYILKDTFKELIVDGLHVDKCTLQSVYNSIGYENINLITDAMRAKQMEDGIYDLGGLEVEKNGMKATIKGTTTLAGSVLQMNNAVKNMIDFSKCTPEEAFQMASYNQSKLFGLETKGLIKEGYDFDITCLNENYEVVQVFKNGKDMI